jgi:hypothetical protein
MTPGHVHLLVEILLPALKESEGREKEGDERGETNPFQQRGRTLDVESVDRQDIGLSADRRWFRHPHFSSAVVCLNFESRTSLSLLTLFERQTEEWLVFEH